GASRDFIRAVPLRRAATLASGREVCTSHNLCRNSHIHARRRPSKNGVSGRGRMDFIFMLTRQDQTVVDCLAVMDAIRPAGLTHLGFKGIGVELDTLKTLHRAIKDQGATSYMEVVSTSQDAMLSSARVARDLGVDRLMGGTDAAGVLEVLAGSGTAYFPFP